MTNKYDIFISYKRKSLPTANNLYYRLTTRGYSTFFDLEEMGRDNFNTQLLNYIENAKDVFVILEEGSLDGCKQDNWEEKDWFCHEIAFALEKKKNIIPILLNGYTMPAEDFFPDKLKEFHLKQAPEFNFTFFEAYLDKLVEKEYLISKPNLQDKATSVFKFYSNENCQVFKEGKLVCSLEGMSDEPFYLPVPRKGEYRFKIINLSTNESKKINEQIDSIEERNVDIIWEQKQNTTDRNCFLDRIHSWGNPVSNNSPLVSLLIYTQLAVYSLALIFVFWTSCFGIFAFYHHPQTAQFMLALFLCVSIFSTVKLYHNSVFWWATIAICDVMEGFYLSVLSKHLFDNWNTYSDLTIPSSMRYRMLYVLGQGMEGHYFMHPLLLVFIILHVLLICMICFKLSK